MFLQRTAVQQGAVLEREQHRAAPSQVQFVVDVFEEVDPQRRERHAGKGAVRMLEAARDRDDPQAARPAADGRADQRLPARVKLVVAEISAVRIVRFDRRFEGGAEQDAMLVIHEQIVQEPGLVRHQQQVRPQALDGGAAAFVRFRALDHAFERQVRAPEGRVGLEGQCPRHVGRGHARPLQCRPAQGPDTPGRRGKRHQAEQAGRDHDAQGEVGFFCTQLRKAVGLVGIGHGKGKA